MLIILDRDGVINEDSPYFIKSPQEWHAIPGSLETIAALNRSGHQVVVASNQSGVARGYFSLTTLLAIHHKMQTELSRVGGHFDAVYFCPHRSEDHCPCRKPAAGMLTQIAIDFATDLTQSAYLIGDSLRDIQAARAVGCRAALVKTGKNTESLSADEILQTPSYKNLYEACQQIF